jgi:hypothetical protein
MPSRVLDSLDFKSDWDEFRRLRSVRLDAQMTKAGIR